MIQGAWDITVFDGDLVYPSWVDLGENPRFVGRWGSARPVPRVEIQGECVFFALGKQYEGRETDLVFRGQLVGDALIGTTTNDRGHEIRWTASRCPELPNHAVTEGETIELVGTDLSGWYPRTPGGQSNWRISEDGLENTATGSDLISRFPLQDFRLVAEYRYPAGSNSGIYLRGRYEFQVLDDHGQAPSLGSSAAIYGFYAPSVNAIRPAGEWNVAEITLIGRTITVVLNGETVIDQKVIPGITGGALDSAEGQASPLFVQGDHGPVTYRRLTVTHLV